MGVIRWIVGFFITIAVLVFAASNRQVVEVFYTPFTPSIELPLYMVTLGLMATGFVLGAFMVWLNEAKVRRERRRQRREIRELQKELKNAGEDNEIKPPPSEFFPALPKRLKN